MMSTFYVSSKPRPHWLEGLRVQIRVIGALLMREALKKHGHQGLGFFWVIGEPLLLTSGIIVLWSSTKMTHGGDVGIVPFALSAYTFVTLWRHIVFGSVRTFSQNQLLLYHRQVDLLDISIAKAVLETVSLVASFIIAYIPLHLLGFIDYLRDPLVIVLGFVLTGWFSFGFGLLLASLTEIWEMGEHFVGPIMYITMPFTGIFFLVDWLPESVRRIMLWSPLVNAIEMIRSGILPEEVNTHWSSSYLIVVCVATTVGGLWTYSIAKKHAQQ